jgi:serine phosphatase RsbU (regulator of sigma subunit)
LGTEGGGLYKFDGLQFTNYPMVEGAATKNAYAVVVDDQDHIWVGTSTGVYRYNKDNGKFSHYGRKEGFMGVETSIDAAFKDHRGQLWFGTINGAVKYNPAKDFKNKTPPTPHITGLKLFYKDVSFPKDNTLSYQDKQITFEYTAISLANPQQVRYQHKLEGFNEKWSPITSKTSAEFSNLPPGEYTFKVKARNADGIWTKTPATYSFTIPPPFWMTWWFYLSCGITGALSLYGFMRWRTYRIRREKYVLEQKVRERTKALQQQKEKVEETNKILADQKDIIEQKNKDITDSIRYAQRIQRAILPEVSIIKNAFPDSFVFYKPCGIVSGDFYFYQKVDDKDLIAAVDCTGHGVPGALMSMIGANALSQIIKGNRQTNPGKVLNELDREIENTLQKETDLEVNDGMDLILCTIDRTANKLYASGALRPLYLIREGKLLEYKGNRFSIGGHSMGMEKDFQTDTIDIQKGDTIYIFSDGYPDQFGGSKGKKFMVKRFKRLLQGIAGKTMDQQKQILKQTIEDWMQENGEEQIDDILIIGLKF